MPNYGGESSGPSDLGGGNYTGGSGDGTGNSASDVVGQAYQDFLAEQGLLDVAMPEPDYSFIQSIMGPQFDTSNMNPAALAMMGPIGAATGITMGSPQFNALSQQDRDLLSSMINESGGFDISANEMSDSQRAALSNYMSNVSNTGNFGNIEDAGLHAANQAAMLLGQDAPLQSFGDLTNASFSMAQDISNQPWTGNALNAVNNIMGQSNPYINQFGDTNNPNNFNAFTNAQSGYGDTFRNMSQQTNPYGGQITNSFQSNPFLAGFNSASNPWASELNTNNVNPNRAQTAFNNPYLASMNDSAPLTANMNDSNPFLQGLRDFGSQQNAAFDTTVDRAMDSVSDRVNSQFGLANRTGSGMHNKVTTEALGDVANQMYSDNFANNQNRVLQSLQSGAGVYGADQSRNLQGTGMNIDAYNAAQNRNLQGTGLNQSAYNTGQSLGLQGTGLNMDAYNADQNRNLANTQAGINAYNTDASRALTANQMGSDAFNTDQNRKLNTLINAGNFANQDFSNQLNAANAGTNDWLNNQNLNMSATGQNADLWQQGFNNQFNANQANSNLYNTDLNRQIATAGMLPDLQNSQYQGALTLNQLGQQQDNQNFYNANSGWNNLNNYANIVSAIQGTQNPPRYESSSTDNALGMMALMGAFM